jgi:anti-sigma regulatory factor (Ser/Thr protein kinase)
MTVPLARQYVVELHASDERVPQIRRIVATHLRHWTLDLHVEPVGAALDELMTNVRRHAGGAAEGVRCVVGLRLSGRHLTVSVEDGGPCMPRLLTAGGGGLSRVAALSDSWGTCATPGGKVVWFTRSVASPDDVFRVAGIPVGVVGTAARSRPAGPAAPVAAPGPVVVPDSVPALV